MSLANLYFSGWLHPGTNHSIDFGGLSRSYVVHVPKGHDAAAALPVVLAFHGATMTGAMMAWFSDLNRKADEAGFIAVYPNGTGKRSSLFWNGGNCCGSAMQNQIDDVGFVDALLDDLYRTYRVDTRRVYATGMSNGGIMVYRLAAELAHRIAAIAPVAGCRESEIGRPQRPVSVLHFHGTHDEFVPYTGGVGSKSITGTDFRSVEESIQGWVDWNGCEAKPRIDVLSKAGDELTVTRKTYGEGKEGTEVVLVTIDGGGHTWPGRKGMTRMLGRSTLNVSANDLMWEFFQKHPLS